jgi:hypothetical protein
MGVLFDRKPRTYAPPPGEPKPTMLDQASMPATTESTGGRRAVLVDLPGRPASYLDSEFAPKVDAFVRYVREAGHDISFTSAHRTQQEQDDLIKSGKGITPADQSLHSARWAVDIGGFDSFSESKKLAVRKAAERAGLSWGGTFTPKPDRIHFHVDPIPGQDRTELIANFAEQIRRLERRQ